MTRPRDVIESFLEQVRVQPNHPAVVEAGRPITYGELEASARRIASALSPIEAPSVVIALPQGGQAYAAMLGVGLAGGFYVPANVESPVEKIQRIVKAVQPDAVIASSIALARDFARDSSASILMDESSFSQCAPAPGTGERHEIAYVMFTSGSTGTPKGVMIPRSALDHYVQVTIADLGLRPDDRIAQHPNIAFDVSIFGIYGSLCSGATAFPLVSAGDRLMPARFIQREKLSVWISVPSVVSLMMQAKDVTAERLASIRLFVFCGEPLLPLHLESLFNARPSCRIVNTYGPTETTVSVTSLSLSKETYLSACGATVALGDPIPGSAIRLVGGPSAQEGEIVITGRQLAIGYWNAPELTADKFKSVCIDGADVRGYFTGDWAVRRGNHLFFQERMDFQVKIRGYRIETEEVATAIRRCGWPVVCVFKQGESLLAVVEAYPGAEFDEAQLRAQLSGMLEEYAIPAFIRLMDRLPRNQNDKIDLAAVKTWYVAQLSERS